MELSTTATSYQQQFSEYWEISNELLLTIGQKLYDKLAIEYLKEKRSKMTEKQDLYEQNLE